MASGLEESNASQRAVGKRSQRATGVAVCRPASTRGGPWRVLRTAQHATEQHAPRCMARCTDHQPSSWPCRSGTCLPSIPPVAQLLAEADPRHARWDLDGALACRQWLPQGVYTQGLLAAPCALLAPPCALLAPPYALHAAQHAGPVGGHVKGSSGAIHQLTAAFQAEPQSWHARLPNHRLRHTPASVPPASQVGVGVGQHAEFSSMVCRVRAPGYPRAKLAASLFSSSVFRPGWPVHSCIGVKLL
jgi:hypothetical protein